MLFCRLLGNLHPQFSAGPPSLPLGAHTCIVAIDAIKVIDTPIAMLSPGLWTCRWLTSLRQRYACSRAVPSRAASTDNNGNLQTRAESAFYKGQKPPPTVLSRATQEYAANERSFRRTAFGDWSPSARTMHEGIVSGRLSAASHLESSIASNTVSIETVRVCLDAEMTRILKYSRNARHALFQRQKTQFARTILLYLWSHPKLWMPLLIGDNEARVQLCYFAVAEKAEHFLEDWLVVHVPEELTAWASEHCSWGTSTPEVAWRNRLLRAITAAHLMHDVSYSADSAIRCYLRLDSVVKQAKRRFYQEPEKPCPAVVRTSMMSALSNLRSELVTGKYQRTDPELWDLVVRRTREFATLHAAETIATQFSLSALSLHHPTKPKVTDTLAFLERYFLEASDSVAKENRKLVPATDEVLRLFLTEASTMARKDGQEQRAACIEALITKLLPPDTGRARLRGTTPQ
ncbi:hypothetical protein CERZMDRAFT_119188 [Cercospora zeae-maydis SCOH1-5]|uniref:Uncharacterized protein n=1 Tax=Cercospora zeae-maydis SCOH1-5 TaxID=717836 RepID=A0A6A6F183_9PEZI|nr:hypothetical protein CERZMDRAFT_119188 [Cercospora zeae-maydis SCOH1-5]